ncbi:DNA replication licensing factor [Hafnia phage yong3]|nr:DNA replication licensing factor [Hafnia phage yong3]
MQLFPAEIKAFPQWAVAAANKCPLVYDPDLGKLIAADTTDPDMLMTFDSAVACAAHYGMPYVGFVLTDNDPYCCIDLDVKNQTNEADPKKWTTPEQLNRFTQIMTTFDTYTEVSRSGLGVHLWLKGDTGKGRRRDGVEVYSRERFIICTGNPVQGYNKPVEERDHYLTMLCNEIDLNRKDYEIELVELPEIESDSDLHAKALAADNGDKYQRLFNGEWVEMGFPSQSEADLALISMYTFYSPSNEQCRRMFRYSALGKRDKANKNNVHIDRCLRMCRGRMERERIAQENVAQMAAQYAAKMQAAHDAVTTIAEQPMQILSTQGLVDLPDIETTATKIDWPPGLTGELAKYIFSCSVRPVKEIAIITALGFMSGVCGKAWHIPQSGLNGYYILVARSGVGKEALNSGISFITNQIKSKIANVEYFVSFDKFSSGPALRKTFKDKQCFVNVNGEFGKILKAMSESHVTGPMQTFRNDLTDIYQKSGPGSMVSGMAYSDAANNTQTQSGVAYSLMGETTPDTFFQSLTREMMEDGFLSRFHVVRYEGDRPAFNKGAANTKMSQGLFDMTCQLVERSLQLLMSYNTVEVRFDPEAEDMCDRFNDECDDNINASKDEAIRQPWNRAHLKVLRLCALLAVGENWIQPVVYPHHVKWAIDFVRHGQDVIMNEWKRGGIGGDEEARQRIVRQVIINYLKNTTAKCRSTKLRGEGIITKSDIQTRVAAKAAFKNHKNGFAWALDNVIKNLVENGVLIPVGREKAAQLQFTGQAWHIDPSVEMEVVIED